MNKDIPVKKECQNEFEAAGVEHGEKKEKKVEDVQKGTQKEDSIDTVEKNQCEHEQVQESESDIEGEGGDEQKIEGTESISSLKQELEDKKRELDELINKFARLQADFDNYKKRVAKERQEMSLYILEDLVSQLLPVVDNFERALDSAKSTGENESLLNGLNMIFKQIKGIMEKNGVKEIEAKEKEFNPRLHEAVMQEETDKYPSNTVIEVLQKGYTLNNKVIRPSLVKVAK
ncbi:MAG: molecular chaperone GrpE [Thermosediminibacterales bacterium]|nr:molecular chaperone GrpE [Thermosediminibacterales bacterium]